MQTYCSERRQILYKTVHHDILVTLSRYEPSVMCVWIGHHNCHCRRLTMYCIQKRHIVISTDIIYLKSVISAVVQYASMDADETLLAT